eukprot:4205173-Alexandrium_andersonii.AAC.1
MKHGVRRSETALRWPKNGLNVGARSSQWVHSVPLFAQTSNLPASTGRDGRPRSGSRESANSTSA